MNYVCITSKGNTYSLRRLDFLTFNEVRTSNTNRFVKIYKATFILLNETNEQDLILQ